MLSSNHTNARKNREYKRMRNPPHNAISGSVVIGRDEEHSGQNNDSGDLHRRSRILIKVAIVEPSLQSFTTESQVDFRMQNRKLENLELRLRGETRAFGPANES